MAHCRESQGNTADALKLHRENARRGSELEDTYERLSTLGETQGDLEAVRTGCAWLQQVAGQFGLIDLRAKARLERVEKRAERGTLGPASDEPHAQERRPSPTRTGCALVIAVVFVLAGVVMARIA